MKMWPLIVAACLASTASHAQQSKLSGRWYGAIDGYPFGEPRRILNVVDRNGVLACTWQEIGKSIDRTACTVQSDTITLVTGAGSAVELSSKGNTLQGTFTLKDGRRFELSMGRDPVPAGAQPSTSGAQGATLNAPPNTVRWRSTLSFNTAEASKDKCNGWTKTVVYTFVLKGNRLEIVTPSGTRTSATVGSDGSVDHTFTTNLNNQPHITGNAFTKHLKVSMYNGVCVWDALPAK
ncbi:MAG: hypothetical protein EPO10_12585 [Reyranella sp.]|uniref:hypothetical protein n=1 Tax=Reyranella sp. TaxID=1929291 RepID=UPI001220241D|nr:hypothetical protein [Reyranella sp.]TAJ96116.1 MAG: hypothetical protein EPO41_07825 [Reyranella sp.]TBR28526.1 MAG: hypothetical protein EPO10_12585 [Reyranella sp.]